MKRFTSIAIVLVLLVCSLVACGGTKPASDVTPYEGAIAELVTKMYETSPVEFAVFTEGQPVDLADAEAVLAYTGLESADGIAEAVFSEPMMMAQAYSLVILKLSDTAKAEEIKNTMFNGINTRKWICVEADQLRVVSAADLVMLVMVDSQLGDGNVADSMVEAFKTNVGELTGETLTRG